MFKLGSHVHIVAPEVQAKQGKEPRTIWRKKERRGSSKEGNSVPQRGERGSRLTQVTAVYLGVSGTEWNIPQIHSSHS